MFSTKMQTDLATNHLAGINISIHEAQEISR